MNWKVLKNEKPGESKSKYHFDDFWVYNGVSVFIAYWKYDHFYIPDGQSDIILFDVTHWGDLVYPDPPIK